MDEEKKTDIMETNISPSPPSLTWRDGAIPLLALALAWLFWVCFGPENTGLPHLGILALVCAHFAAGFTVLGKRVRLHAGSLFCTASALALGLACALYHSPVFVVLNCLVILPAAAMATFALSGHLAPGLPAALWQTVRLSFAAFFTRLGRPFLALGMACRRGRAQVGQALLAAAIALPVLGVVLWLLASADPVFAGIFSGFRLDAIPEGALVRTARVLALVPFLASALYFIRQAGPAPEKTAPVRPRYAAPFLPVTGLLDAVYTVFCVIQIRYLFGGAEAASMAGGWAEYARSGFFQLVAVAVIDLGLCLLGTDAGRFASPGGRALRALLGVLLALTAVILVSAFWRMRLYILAYGMSILRLLTLWAMAVVCVGLLAAARKLVRPGFGFFRVAGAFALALWCALCLANPCGMIADYNVDRYLSGRLEQVDTFYLRNLGRDALPALRRLDGAGEPECRYLIRQLEQDGADRVPWPQWCLSASRAEK